MLMLLGVLVMSATLTGLYQAPASAALNNPIKWSGLTLAQKATALADAKILMTCVGSATQGGTPSVGIETNEVHIKNGRMVYQNLATSVQRVYAWDSKLVNYHQSFADDNEMSCTEYDVAVVVGAMKRLGLNPIKMMCDLGFTRERGGTDCENNTGNFNKETAGFVNNKSADQIAAAITKQITGFNPSSPGNAVLYLYNLTILKEGCLGTPATFAQWDAEGGDTRYNIHKYPQSASVTAESKEQDYYFARARKQDKPMTTQSKPNAGDQKGDVTCREYWESVRTYYQDYKSYMDALDGDEKEKEEQAVNDGTTAADEEPPTCGSIVTGIGWIVCPVLDGIAGLNDAMWNMVSALLEVNPLKQTDDSGTETPFYNLWGAFRSIANVLLVIAFIIIIYTQLTGAGVSNYGVKKMLPRLLVMAIAINLSWFVVAIAVDVFNIMGKSIYELLKGFMYDDVAANVNWNGLIGIIVGLGAAGGIAIGSIAIAGGAQAVLLMLLPAALIALLGVFAALVTLMVRSAIIPIIAILAPLAFAAYLLPNTQQWFTRWRTLFISMLALYPIAALLFGGLQVAGKAIAGSGEWFSVVTALVVMAAPLFMLPFIAAKSGSMLSALNGKLRGLGARASKPLGSWAQGRANHAKAKYDASGIRTGRNGQPILRDSVKALRGGFQRRARTRELGTAAYNAERDAAFNQYVSENGAELAEGHGTVGAAYIGATAQRATAESIKNAELAADIAPGDIAGMARAFAEAVKKGDSITARAMQNKMLASGGAGIDAYRGAMASTESGMSGEMKSSLRENVLSNHAGLKSRAADLTSWASDGSGRDFASVTGDAKTWNMSDAEFAGQHKTSQSAAMSAGGVNREQAQRIMGDARLSAELDPAVRTSLSRLAEGSGSEIHIDHQ